MEMTPTPIDLLLSGVTLPGFQGPEFAATAVAARPAMKVLLISDDVDRIVGAANAFGAVGSSSRSPSPHPH